MSELNTHQEEAVNYCDGPLLMVAGPGSGKTRVLIEKVSYLINKKKIKPENIVLTTFTINAAEELRQKIQNNIRNKDISAMFIGTIDSFCDNLIKQFGGTSEKIIQYETLDDVKRYFLIKKYFKRLKIDKEILNNIYISYNKDIIVGLLKFYDIVTTNLIDVTELKNRILEDKDKIIQEKQKKIKDKQLSDESIFKCILAVVDSYNIYKEILIENNYSDFSNIEKTSLNILNNKRILEDVQQKYKYILIDEFQDINPLQWKIFNKIAQKYKNIYVVGDKNQAIYGFRGANANIFDKFTEEFKNVKIIPLDINYRSKKDIVDLSNEFINQMKLEQNTKIMMKSDRQNKRTEIYSLVLDTDKIASKQIIELIKSLYTKKIIKQYGDVAILYRSIKTSAKELILELSNSEIPYEIYGTSNILRNKEIENIIDLMSYCYGELDPKSVFQNEYINFSDSEIKVIDENNLDIIKIYKPEILSKYGVSLEKSNRFISLNELLKVNLSKKPNTIQESFFKIISILNILYLEETPKNIRIKRNLGKLTEIITSYSSFFKNTDYKRFRQLLNSLPENFGSKNNLDDLFIEIDQEPLKIMTVHQAKGLEFPIVIIPSIIYRRFPISNTNKQEILDVPKEFYLYDPVNPELEEQKLFYVAVTRAQDGLILSKFENYENAEKKRKTSESKFYLALKEKIKELDKISNINICVDNRKLRNKKISIFDYSALSSYVDCPERFLYRYLYGLTAEDIFTQKLGNIYHNSVAKINSNIKESSKLNFNQIKEIVFDSWVSLKKGDETAHKIKVSKELYNYYNKINSDLKSIDHIEKPVGINYDDIRLRGKIDLLYTNKKGQLVLVDFKSRKSSEIETTHVDLQLRLYSKALDSEGIKIDRLVAYPLQEVNKDLYDGELSNNKKDSIDTDKKVEYFIRDLRNKKLSSKDTNSKFCKTCPYGICCKHKKA